MYSTDWCVYKFVLEVGLAEEVLLFVAHSDSLHNFIILYIPGWVCEPVEKLARLRKLGLK